LSVFKADLHCHTTCSDGSYSPEELIAHAHAIGLKGLSITDHDSVASYQVAPEIAKKYGISLGSGVEFSCSFHGISVHILGYDFLLSKPEVHELCQRHQKRRIDRNRKILEKLKKYKMTLDEAELGKGKTIGRPHIAEAMVKRGYVQSVREAFHKYLAEDRPCYDPGEPFHVEEAIDVLHAAKGKAFVAHPHLLPKQLSLKALLELPFDGLECYYARFPLDASKRFLEIAANRKLLISGGSDFHGSVKPDIPLGASFVDQAVFDTIFSHENLL